MDCTGHIKGIAKDFLTGSVLLTVSVNEPVEQEAERLGTDNLAICMKKWRKKRSLDANAYFHVLVGKIAEALTISKAKEKNILICKYGQPVLFNDGEFLFYKTNAPIEYMAEIEEPHMMFVRVMQDGMYMYKQYRGSHTYDTKEMSSLIDGTVADAKEIGIETMTPDDLNRMKELWKPRKD